MFKINKKLFLVLLGCGIFQSAQPMFGKFLTCVSAFFVAAQPQQLQALPEIASDDWVILGETSAPAIQAQPEPLAQPSIRERAAMFAAPAGIPGQVNAAPGGRTERIEVSGKAYGYMPRDWGNRPRDSQGRTLH